jgi:hypothetical protein
LGLLYVILLRGETPKFVRVTTALFKTKTGKQHIMSNTSSSTNTGAAVAPLVPNVPSQQGASSSGSSNLTAEQQQQQLQLQYQQQQLQQQQQSGSSQQGQVTQPGQVQPAPQQHFPHQGLNGGWQSDKDVQERRKMIAKM